MFAILQRRLGQLEMRPDRRDDGHGIQVWRGKDVVYVGSDVHVRKGLLRSLQRFWPLVANDCDLGVRDGMEISDNIRPPVTIPDDADSNHGEPPGENELA